MSKTNIKKRMSVTIGIPAFNEEANLKLLLGRILSQNQKNYFLEKIIVISDKSTDSTDEIIKKFTKKNVVLKRNSNQIGKALSQNILTRLAKSDLLIIFDADILLGSKNTIDYLVNPFYEDKSIMLASGRPKPLPSHTFLEEIINFSIGIKEQIYENINSGNNIFLCHGRIRAFRKKFYKSFKWRAVAGEDAFSYLMCKRQGWNFKYVKKAVVFYRSPNNLRDHLRQSTRFIKGNTRMRRFFPQKLVTREYKRPILLELKVLLNSLIKNPFKTLFYLSIYTYSAILSVITPDQPGSWKTSTTTKYLK